MQSLLLLVFIIISILGGELTPFATSYKLQDSSL